MVLAYRTQRGSGIGGEPELSRRDDHAKRRPDKLRQVAVLGVCQHPVELSFAIVIGCQYVVDPARVVRIEIDCTLDELDTTVPVACVREQHTHVGDGGRVQGVERHDAIGGNAQPAGQSFRIDDINAGDELPLNGLVPVAIS